MQLLYDKLKSFGQSDAYPFHMPGHKRRGMDFENPYQIDITEIEGFDNLHHAQGILKEAEERAAHLYGSEETYFCVNGSTAGILSAISACVPCGSRILMARNCHKAAYHAVFLRQLEVTYIYPQKVGQLGINGGLLPEKVEEMLIKYPDIRAVFITSPTYDGIVSDVGGIAEAAHRHHVPLIVDEAHGAHFGFHEYFPESSVKQGADIVIHSLHKTLPCLTQTALVHVNGKLADRAALRDYLGIYQTSSPSYVLMASMDSCVGLLRERGEELFESYVKRLKEFRERAQALHRIRVADIERRADIYDVDMSKIIISDIKGKIPGNELYERLRCEYGLWLEMAAGRYALAMTSVMDTREGYDRLVRALYSIDEEVPHIWETDLQESGCCQKEDGLPENTAVLPIWKAAGRGDDGYRRKRLMLQESEGEISAEYMYLYPPGIPLIVPGEKISGEFIEKVLQYKKLGHSIQGCSDYEAESIEVLERC